MLLPVPVSDLRFRLSGVRAGRQDKRFLIHEPKHLRLWLDRLPNAAPGSWLEVRNWAMEVLTLKRDATGITLVHGGQTEQIAAEAITGLVRDFVQHDAPEHSPSLEPAKG